MQQDWSDEELVRQVCDGKKEAFRTLVERYSPMVFQIARAYSRDSDEVADLAQETFIKAYDRLTEFRKRSRFSSWLYAICRNHCLDYAKNIRRTIQRLGDESDGGRIDCMTNGPTPMEYVETLEESQLLENAIATLHPDYATPFLLKYREGMAYTEIAEIMGASIGALKVRVHRARLELQELLRESHDGTYN